MEVPEMTEEKKPVGRPKAERKRTERVQVRCYPEWAEWLNAVAVARGMGVADVIEEGVKTWAARRKDLPPMPER